MGHTVSSQRQVVQTILDELNAYGKSIRQEDREAFDRLVAGAMVHFGDISFTCSYNTWAFVLFSMMLEQEKRLMEYRKSTEALS